jgi:hypothetical protein
MIRDDPKKFLLPGFVYGNGIPVVFKKIEAPRRFVSYVFPSQYDSYYKENGKEYKQFDI